MSSSGDPACRRRRIASYSGSLTAEPEVCTPRSEAELRRVFARAVRERRRVTLRAGGHSFDGQSIGVDLVVSMTGMDAIRVCPRERLVHVGPGATWGAIVARLERHGLVPASTVTTSGATAGGTLAGNCLSRFSPVYGKEGTWVVGARVMTVDGTVHDCRPPLPQLAEDEWSPCERLFMGAVGGLGYLGAFTQITLRALKVRTPVRVRTEVQTLTGFGELARELVAQGEAAEAALGDPCDEHTADALYAAISSDLGSEESLVFRSRYAVTSRGDRRSLLFRPRFVLRPLVEMALRRKAPNRWLWRWAWRGYRRRPVSVDLLPGFTFFMDGNVRAKALAAVFGADLKTVQQTFVVSSGRLVAWLEEVRRVLQEQGLTPTLADVLFLPRDRPFLLSATFDAPGLAVSFAFDTSDAGEIDQVREVFSGLSRTLLEDYGGRVYLVKNVCADRGTLQAMYGDRVGRFFALKHDVDPAGVLCNDFLERVFGPPSAWPGAGGDGGATATAPAALTG